MESSILILIEWLLSHTLSPVLLNFPKETLKLIKFPEYKGTNVATRGYEPFHHLFYPTAKSCIYCDIKDAYVSPKCKSFNSKFNLEFSDCAKFLSTLLFNVGYASDSFTVIPAGLKSHSTCWNRNS